MNTLEQIARAICIATDDDPDREGERLTAYDAAARAAIEAMREPTEAMVNRAWALIGSNLRYEEVYRHMIAASLLDSPHTKGDEA